MTNRENQGGDSMNEATHRWDVAQKKCLDLGPLSFTAEDHRDVAGTPPQKLVDNPGKTEADVRTDEELLEWLQGKQKFLIEMQEEERSKGRAFYPPKKLQDEFEVTVKYLKSIGRCPKDFE